MTANMWLSSAKRAQISRTIVISILIALTLVLPVAWCESPPRGDKPSELSKMGRLTIPVVFLGEDMNAAETPDGPDFLVTLVPISGHLYGQPEDHSIQVDVSGEMTMTLFPRYLDTVGRQFAENADLEGMDVTVTPANTRVSRFGTFLNDRISETNWGAGFIDLETSDSLLLIYVDRPCRIQGSATFPDRTAEFDITIPNYGLNWVRIQRDTNSYRMIWTEKPKQPALFGISK